MISARRIKIVVLAVLALGVAGCGSDDSLAGVWTGGFRDSLGILGGGNFTFTQQGSVLGGTWQVLYSAIGAAKYNNSGSLTGTVSGNAIAAVMSSQGPCPFTLQATRSGNTMTGSYTTTNCSPAESGTVDLEKQ